MKILVLNAGSSSQKCCLYEIGPDGPPETAPEPLWEALADGTALEVLEPGHDSQHESLASSAPAETLPHVLATMWTGETKVIEGPGEIDIVGHRVVHGGQSYRVPTRVTPEVKAEIQRLCPLAPAHNPGALAGIEAVEKLLGQAPQIAVFDTAFHATIPEAAAVYPGPYEWVEQGIRRYGFHGISHADCAARAAKLLGRDLKSLRLITCHLGNGCSLAAIRDGASVDTTMGFTPLEGLMMGTRSGSIDPGILTYLMREHGYSADDLDRILNKESGLKGVSGVSGDLREVTTAIEGGNARARLALEVYLHRLRSCAGAMLASLGGLDALVFTAGVGEHSAGVRAGVCEAFGFLELELDSAKNEKGHGDREIAAEGSKVRVLVIKAQEDWAIARECWRLARPS